MTLPSNGLKEQELGEQSCGPPGRIKHRWHVPSVKEPHWRPISASTFDGYGQSFARSVQVLEGRASTDCGILTILAPTKGIPGLLSRMIWTQTVWCSLQLKHPRDMHPSTVRQKVWERIDAQRPRISTQFKQKPAIGSGQSANRPKLETQFSLSNSHPCAILSACQSTFADPESSSPYWPQWG